MCRPTRSIGSSSVTGCRTCPGSATAPGRGDAGSCTCPASRSRSMLSTSSWAAGASTSSRPLTKRRATYAHNSIRSATDFVDELRRRFPAAIQRIQTDHGSEFGTDFTWHLRDLGLAHRHIPRGCPESNGKVERSHRTDEDEFYRRTILRSQAELAQQPVLHRFDALGEAVVLVRHFVLPGAEAAAAPDVVGLEGRQRHVQSPIVMERGRGIAVFEAAVPDVVHGLPTRDESGPHQSL